MEYIMYSITYNTVYYVLYMCDIHTLIFSFVQVILFLCMFCGSIFLLFHVKVGLDQELAMPSVSSMNKQ